MLEPNIGPTANIVAPRIASPSYARVRAELSQIYIPCLSRGETDKGEANDGVDPLKREEDVEVGVTKSRGNKL